MRVLLCSIIGASLVTTVAMGDIYYDPVGDIATGNLNLDLTQVEITDDGLDLFISLTVADLDADWGKYMIFLDYNPHPDAGSPDNNNPWNRNVSGLAGTETFAGAWLDNGGGLQILDWQPFVNYWGGSAFYGSYIDIDWATDTISFTFIDFVEKMRAEPNWDSNGVYFEVGTTGGNEGDPAIDLLGGQGGNWGEGSTGAWTYYEFSTVPAPGALALLALAGLGRRRRL